MIFRRLRARAPLVLSLLCLGIGLAMSAAAQGNAPASTVSQPVTQREFYSVLASGFVLVVLGTYGAMRFTLGLSLGEFKRIAARLEAAVSTFEDRQYNHNESASAHTIALKPVNERIDKLKDDLAEAVEEALGHRAKRRATDPQHGGPNDSGPDWADVVEAEHAARLRGRQ